MKRSILIAVGSLLLLASSASFAAIPSVRDQQVKFAREYVAALQSKNKARIVEFFHPTVRACMTNRNRQFFDEIVAQQLQGVPRRNYTRITDTPVTPKSSPSLWAFVPAKGFPYPVLPTYHIQIDFDSTPNGLLVYMLEVAPSGSAWYLVTACPNADGMRFMQGMLERGARQKEMAKKLASKLRSPLLAHIRNLLAEHDRMGAVQAYQKSTGADLKTAASVIDEIENPHS